jgi:hypothetical protein
MLRFDGSLARSLNFDDLTPDGPLVRPGRASSSSARLRLHLELAPGPDKYKALEMRRRSAQIKARHALDLVDVMEHAVEARLKPCAADVVTAKGS